MLASGHQRTRGYGRSQLQHFVSPQSAASNDGRLTFDSAPPELPKLTLRFCPWLGGLPPLAAGCGMGDGEFAGEVIRGFDGLWTPSEPGA